LGRKLTSHIEPQSLQQHGNSKSGNFSALESYTTYQIHLVLLSLSLYATSYSSAWTFSSQVYFPAALTLLCGEIGGGDTTSFRHVKNFALGLTGSLLRSSSSVFHIALSEQIGNFLCSKATLISQKADAM
jgi:hypothetical protein